MRFNRNQSIEDVLIIGSHARCHIMQSIPTLGMVPIEWAFTSMRLQMPINGQVFQHIPKGMEVGEARNKAGTDIMNIEKSQRPKYLFFLGDDMLPEWDGFVKLYEAMEEEKWDVLTGLYYMKGEPPTPLVWRNDHIGRMQPGKDFKVGERVWVDLTGLDFTLIRTSLLEKMTPPYFRTGPSLRGEVPDDMKDLMTKLQRGTQLDQRVEPWIELKSLVMHTEDVWFCAKARLLGAKMGVHSGVRVSHFDVKSGAYY